MDMDLEKMKESILTRKDAQELLKVSYVTLYTWAKKGVIREHHLGRSVYYLKEELIEDLKKN